MKKGDRVRVIENKDDTLRKGVEEYYKTGAEGIIVHCETKECLVEFDKGVYYKPYGGKWYVLYASLELIKEEKK